ncbi:uncharacterized protein LOC121192690 [Toxotes jaculatrix]|uniref:uncharacterized protein LOC121192690 n=1 Tax=Toxotes jaculatrix TaxID=941984 RepID=UPI001B3ABAC3|nr:uncharacterized protein LOC121192690 [Toxotes jaculatrix]XP_040910422.1 uncharacterized protein LOC121192690 [Toxotes jaculatrix]
MICWILQLIILTSCVCAGAFVVTVTQSSYQAEEKHNVTLEWRFTPKPDSSSNSLYIYCQLITGHKVSVLYRVHKGVEVPESQDEQFSGRVQCNKDVLRDGQIRLHVSSLRTEDSGLYLCVVRTDYGGSNDKCQLTVSAAADPPKPHRPTVSPQPESRGRIALYAGLGLGLVLGLAAALLVKFCFASRAERDRERQRDRACWSMRLLFPADPVRPLTFQLSHCLHALRQTERQTEGVGSPD